MSAAEKDIQTALAVRLKAFQTDGSPPIAYENEDYEPVIGTLYLEETFMPNTKDPVGISHTSSDDYEGMYQITVRSAKGGRRFDAQEQARLLALHFPRGAEYTYNSTKVKIVTVEVNQGLMDNERYIVPVTVSWRVLA